MISVLSFITNHWRVLLGVYIIGAVVTFVATAIFLTRAIREEDKVKYELLNEHNPSALEKD